MTPGGEMARSAPLTSYEDEAAETQRAIATIGQKNTAVVRRRHTSNGTARTVADMCLSRLCRCIGTSDEKKICMASRARLDAHLVPVEPFLIRVHWQRKGPVEKLLRSYDGLMTTSTRPILTR